MSVTLAMIVISVAIYVIINFIDHSAESFNMGSLEATRWKLQGSTLTVFGEDAAGGVVVPFALDFDVIESTDSTLTIRQGVLVHRFSKR